MENYHIEFKGMIKSSFLDWDGKIVTTLYLPRCNFRCPFCHNWELTDMPEKFDTIPFPDIERHLQNNRDFLDGVCITGGEPTLYEDLPKIIERILEIGLEVKLDTNGSNPSLLRSLIEDGLINYIAMDIKAPIDERYNKIAGVQVDKAKIQESVNILLESAIDYEFRTTVVPTLHTINDIELIAAMISGAKKYALQQFVPENARAQSLQNIMAFDRKTLETIRDRISDKVQNVFLRGLK